MLAMVSRIKKFFELRLPALVLSMSLAATLNVAFAKVNVGSDGVAIHGYDVVAYFLEGRAAQGTTEFEHSWQDANWRFSSEANKNLFIADPKRYAPQYGGFCAACLALDGELTDANPKAWTIVDGKLYLNYSMHQRTQWRIRSNVYVKYGDDEWTKVLGREKRPEATGPRFKIAVMDPGFFHKGRPWGEGQASDVDLFQNLAGDIYGAIQERSSFVISYADEPPDPSARSEVNRGGAWPFPGTNVGRKEAWEWEGKVRNMTPRLERVYGAGLELGVDAVAMYGFQPVWRMPQWSIEFYVFDIEKKRVYLHKGTNTEARALVGQAFDDFLRGREGYRIAVVKPAYYNADGGAPAAQMIGDLGADIYKSIRQQSPFSIILADEPDDASALGYLNRGGDWPFPPTRVKPSEAWQGGIVHKAPNVERLQQAGQELDVDAVVGWFYAVPQWNVVHWPVEFYVMDVKKQRIYLHEGLNSEIEATVQKAFDDFLAGRSE
jgi:hypothetical protein